MDSSLESSDCGRLLSNQNPVETVSERPREKTVHDKSVPPNRYNQSGCLCLIVFHGTRVVSFKIHQQYNLRRPTRIHLHTVFVQQNPHITGRGRRYAVALLFSIVQ